MTSLWHQKSILSEKNKDTMKSSSLRSIASQLKAKSFHPPFYLKNFHKQTLAGILFNSYKTKKIPTTKRIYLHIDKKTSIALDCSLQSYPTKKPLLILVHGMEGSSDSHYMLRMAVKSFNLGWSTIRVNLRSCGNTEPYAQSIYNAGQSQDINKIINYCIKNKYNKIMLVGFSLGGNICLKLAGEYGKKFPKQIIGIAAVSPALDLAASEKLIDSPKSNFYRVFLLNSLKKRIKRMALVNPCIYNPALFKKIKTIKDFDAAFQVPLLKLKNVSEFYKKASAVSQIPKIALPALIIHAHDDPIAPISPLKRPEILHNKNIIALLTKNGGHVGFISKPSLQEDKYWAENRVLEFFAFLLKPVSTQLAHNLLL